MYVLILNLIPLSSQHIMRIYRLIIVDVHQANIRTKRKLLRDIIVNVFLFALKRLINLNKFLFISYSIVPRSRTHGCSNLVDS